MALHNGKGPRNAYRLPPLSHRLAPQSCLGICSLGGPVQCRQRCIALPTLQPPKLRLEQSGLSWPAPQPTPSAKQPSGGRQLPPAAGLVAMVSEEKKKERIPEPHPKIHTRPLPLLPHSLSPMSKRPFVQPEARATSSLMAGSKGGQRGQGARK